MEEAEEFECSTTVYLYNELSKLVNSDGLINTSLTIRGRDIRKLKGVRKINGNLFLWESLIEDLGELEEVSGDFSISSFYTTSKIITLGKLEKVHQNIRVRYSSIENLGTLKIVGGDLNLRDTNITSITELEKVGGNLYLPSRLRGSVNLDKLDLGGKIKFWKDSKREFTSSHYIDNLVESETEIPHWEFTWINNCYIINNQSDQIRAFYSYFKKSFIDGRFIDLRGETNYLFTLIHEIRDEYSINKNLDLFIIYFNNLSIHYPIIKSYTNRWLVEILDREKKYELLKPHILGKEYHLHLSLIKYFYIIDRTEDKFIDIDIILSMMNLSSLTNFGNKNISEIKSFFLSRINNLDSEYLIELLCYSRKFNLLESIHMNEEDQLFEKKIFTYFERELRESENDCRINLGLPKIGEGWISETELYYKLKNDFLNYSVIHHGKPKWLGRQHLDIFIEELNIGIEYMGAQHYEPIDYFGGEESLNKTRERDMIKIEKCKSNKCYLLIVNEGYLYPEIWTEINNVIQKSNESFEPIIINPIH